MQDTSSQPKASQAGSSGQAFTLVLARSGQSLEVGLGERITDVLHLAGIAVETLCEQGVCGTCITPWLAGEPDHQDSCLSEEERRTHVAVCCARCRSAALTLDL
jgi:ferredoxin